MNAARRENGKYLAYCNNHQAEGSEVSALHIAKLEAILAGLDALDEVERLRTLITEWADAEDLVVIDSDLRLYAAHNNLRKAVGR